VSVTLGNSRETDPQLVKTPRAFLQSRQGSGARACAFSFGLGRLGWNQPITVVFFSFSFSEDLGKFVINGRKILKL
jgi:hypothetical protein